MGQDLARFIVKEKEPEAPKFVVEEEKEEWLVPGSCVAVDLGMYETKAAIFTADMTVYSPSPVTSAVSDEVVGITAFSLGPQSEATVFHIKSCIHEVKGQEACTKLLKAVMKDDHFIDPSTCIFTVPWGFTQTERQKLDICARAAGFVKGARFISDPLALVLHVAGSDLEKFDAWPASQKILSIVVGAGFTSVGLIEARDTKIRLENAFCRGTNSLIERLMAYVFKLWEMDVFDIKQNHFKRWGEMFLFCKPLVETLLSKQEVSFPMNSAYLLSAVAENVGSQDTIKISTELFDSWVLEDMCLPVLSMVQQLRVANCDQIFIAGHATKARAFNEAMQKLARDTEATISTAGDTDNWMASGAAVWATALEGRPRIPDVSISEQLTK